jgi:folate-binding protein YgfZ
LGSDREKFLHGQVTNEVLRLKQGEGAYAAIVTAKGKLEADLFLYKLQEELLLDLEPGLSQKIADRLSRYIIAEDVQIIDVSPFYNLLSVQGPRSTDLLVSAINLSLPIKPFSWTKTPTSSGDLYVMHNGRFGLAGYDLFIPSSDTLSFADKLAAAIRPVGLDSCEISRIENGLPRFGVDMDESNLAPEALKENAISYSKGCYIGQEVIARIRTYGQVAKALRRLHLANDHALPSKGEKVFKNGKEVGFITSSTLSPKHDARIALAYVRKETNSPGETLNVTSVDGPEATIISA